MQQPVHVIGASGRSGQAICRALLERGIAIIPVVRSVERWAATALPGTPRIADLTGNGLGPALADAERVVSCAHARHIPAILANTEAKRLVFLGSTRKFTRWPDAHGNGVMAGEAAFRQSGRPGVILHPTMIYGAAGEDNVQRLSALLRKLPVVPLPGGGRALVQPIYQNDVTQSILAALNISWQRPESLVIAGANPLPYADFVRAVAAASHLPPPRIVPVPPILLRLASPFSRLPGLPRIGTDEIRRLLEDKAFAIGPMRARLGVDPISLGRGLALTFGDQACPSSTASPISTPT